MLWQLQRQYFEEQGIIAWQSGDVPHYITCNPVIAKAYAEMVFGFLKDRSRLAPDNKEKIYLLELGAGSGRLAFHLLKILTKLCDDASFDVPYRHFTYRIPLRGRNREEPGQSV
jgi:SAM-dependent MidA family methyltransferase